MDKLQITKAATALGFHQFTGTRKVSEHEKGKILLCDEGAEESGELAFRIESQDIYGRREWAVGFQFEVPTEVVIAALQAAQLSKL